eukprot:SM000170S02681  [mRNA]  locus=s170:137044:145189:- [translate_table: standard]
MAAPAAAAGVAAVEGYLYAFGRPRGGGGGGGGGDVFCHRTWCVLEGRRFAQFQAQGDEAPLRTGTLDRELRVQDTGRQTVAGKTLYTVRLYNPNEPGKEVKVPEELLICVHDFCAPAGDQLGASSPEEVATWIDNLTRAQHQPESSAPTIDTSRLRVQIGGGPNNDDPDADDAAAAVPPSVSSPGGNSNSLHDELAEARPSLDVEKDGAPATVSRWQLLRCDNGLRFFQEIPDTRSKSLTKLPVVKSVGVVKASPEAIFHLLMACGEDRKQWDATVAHAEVIEEFDGHSDVILHRIFLNRPVDDTNHTEVLCYFYDAYAWHSGIRQRELCIFRYWKREDNGSYLIFFRSIQHRHAPARCRYVRARIDSGGVIISSMSASTGGRARSLVEYVLEMDAGGFASCLSCFGMGPTSYAATLKDTMLSTVAGLREYFAAQQMNPSSTVVRRILVPQGQQVPLPLSLSVREEASRMSLLETDDVDEFFDSRTDQLSEMSEASPCGGSVTSPLQTDLTSPLLERKLTREPSVATTAAERRSRYGSVRRGQLTGERNCWSVPPGSLFRFRKGKSMVAGGEPLCELTAVDWLRVSTPISHVARRSKNIVQKMKKRNRQAYFFVINLQVPGTTVMHSLVFYFAMERAPAEGSVLHQFVCSDEMSRSSRMTLVPAVSEGSWIVKQAVGCRPVPMGQIMEIKYFAGDNYIEADVSMGSSAIVKGVMALVLGYMKHLVVDIGFFLRGDGEDDAAEQLLGTVRCSKIELSSAVSPPP